MKDVLYMTNSINHKKVDNRVRLGIWFLFLEISMCVVNNHKALFIADYYVFIVLYIAAELFRRRFRLVVNKMFIPLFVMLTMSVLFINSIDRGTLLSYVIWIMFMIIGLNSKLNSREICLLKWAFIVGSAIMAYFVITQQHHFYYPGSYRFTIQMFNNMEIDPNYLSAFMYIGAVFALDFILNQKVKKYKIVFILLELIILFAIFMASSRAVFVALLIAVFGVVTNSKGKFRTPILILLIIVFIAILPNVLSEESIARFDFSSLRDESNAKRLSHWGAALLAFVKNPILGYGATHTMDILTRYAGHVSDAHNTLFTLLLHFGIVGFVPICLLFLKIIRNLRKQKQHEMLFYFFGYIFINLIIANHLGISFWIPLLLFYQMGLKKENIPNI
ncbi:hypothetical protein B5E48_05035 [Massilimicrobiota sp. An105]|uniref:O-antigen ligase family protein n=1 Tax=Massilimicrobiota sp. An105 TaxID=1965540 RepID=UPI000B3AC2C6|nr:O-antigen ligase family protein [Massilimicrobiota sp. An105]OUQ80748.1 hypothetical protein B5E48_05035 [Massilimicrobiota sp. An105]